MPEPMKSQNCHLSIRHLPIHLARAIDGYSCNRVTPGYSGAEVFRLERHDRPPLYLKAAACGPEGELRHEMLRLEWIGERLPVPRVLAFAEDEENQYLLISAIAGIDASDPIHDKELPRLVRVLAEGMRRIHALPIEGCPFDQTLERKIEAARVRMLRGFVGEERFDPVRQGRKATDLFAELFRTQPESEDLVFTHGDYCLPNVLIDAGRLSGFIDWGRAGIADRYQDLALAARSLPHNFNTAEVTLLFQEYGIPDPDLARIAFYQLLDEFF